MKATRWILVLTFITAACGSGPTQPDLEDVGSDNASLLGQTDRTDDRVQPPGNEGSNPDIPTSHEGPVVDFNRFIEYLRAGYFARAEGPTQAEGDVAVGVTNTSGGTVVEIVGPVTQPFLTVSGQIIKVNGEEVQVFEYPDAESAAREARILSDGGTVMIMWIAPPTFYVSGRLIVITLTQDEAVLGPLNALLGMPFVGSAAQDLPDDPVGSVGTVDGRTLVGDQAPTRLPTDDAITVDPIDPSVGVSTSVDGTGPVSVLDVDPSDSTDEGPGREVPIGVLPTDNEPGEDLNPDLPVGQPLPGDDQTVRISIKGIVTSVTTDEEGVPVSFLVVGASSSFDSAVIHLVAETRILEMPEGNRQSARAIVIGAEVVITSSGPVRESYPVQIDGTEVLIYNR